MAVAAQLEVFGEPIFRGSDGESIRDTFAPFPTEISAALDLDYDKVWNPVETSRLDVLGGKLIGRERRTLSGNRQLPANSVSSIPVGRGNFVAFGGAVAGDATIIGRDIAQLVFTRFIGSTTYTIVSTDLTLHSNESLSGSLEVPIAADTRSIAVTVYSTADYSPLFVTQVIPVDGLAGAKPR
jgi:hypothetical protein